MDFQTLLDLVRDPLHTIEAIAARFSAATPAERAATRDQLIAISNSAQIQLDASLRIRVATLLKLLDESEASRTLRRQGDARGAPLGVAHREGPLTPVTDGSRFDTVARRRPPDDGSSTRVRAQPGDRIAGAAPKSATLPRFARDAVSQRADVDRAGTAEAEATAAASTRRRVSAGGSTEQLRAQTRFHEFGSGDVVHGWYRLESLLGSGAMGQVWRAVDLQMERAKAPDPHVALKLVSEEFASHEHAMVAMSREADKAKKLAHPHIATVFVFAVDPESGQSYLAMELLEGKPLDRLIQDFKNGIERDRALEIIRGLARGLGYAHSKGIVHCDFKPGNAFVTDKGVAKIMDFGIARLAQEVARVGDNFDAGELAALTPPYASLEMLQEDRPLPDPADDVYALGLVAYEVLTGRHPFDGALATEVLQEGIRLEPIKGLRRREWRAIERALKLRRAERWPDANAFLKALEGISPWVPALAALAATLAIVSTYVGYENYLESLPAVPFEQLPSSVQREFRGAMQEGDYAYHFATTKLEGAEAAAAIYRDAIASYAEAYHLHPKNADADDALRRSLAFLVDRSHEMDYDLKAEAKAVLEDYRVRYKELAKYEPLDRAVEKLAE
jgi:serine/threonine protein kinase